MAAASGIRISTSTGCRAPRRTASVRVELEIDDQPSGLGWLPDGRLLVVAMVSQRVLRREADGRAVLHADLKGLAKFHANDMLVDKHGNAFIGCFGFDLDTFIAEQGPAALWTGDGPPTAPIMRVTPDGKARIASPDHKFPNGMALIDGGKTLVVAECFMPGLTAFDLGDDGVLRNRRTWALLPASPPSIVPDGICSDSEGAIWCANALGPEAVRIGKGGKILERVETSQNAFSCALGGADGRVSSSPPRPMPTPDNRRDRNQRHPRDRAGERAGLSRVDKPAHLAVPEARIGAVVGEQVAVRAVFQDLAVVEIDHAVHAGDGREAMRDGDHGAALHKVHSADWMRCSDSGIERGRRLVQHQDLRASLISARAMATRWRSPPDSLMPCSPTIMS